MCHRLLDGLACSWPSAITSNIFSDMCTGILCASAEANVWRLCGCIQAVMRTWLPLACAALDMAVQHLPSPSAAAPRRAPHVCAAAASAALASAALAALPPPAATHLQRTHAALCASDADADAPLVVYVSKMVAVPLSTLPRTPGEPLPQPDGEGCNDVFLAFGRVWAGVMREGQRVHVLSDAYSPRAPNMHRYDVCICLCSWLNSTAQTRAYINDIHGSCPYISYKHAGIAGLAPYVLNGASVSELTH